MSRKISRTNNYLLQILSLLFGFMFLLAISMEGIWGDCLTALLFVVISSIECLWIKSIKEIEQRHWLASDWLLLASAIAYTFVDDILFKIVFLGVMAVALYANLYGTVYFAPISLKYLKVFIKDFPILIVGYMGALFKRNEYLEIRTKREKRIVGIAVLAVILIGVFLPIYILIDYRVGVILELIVVEVIKSFPIWIMCALLGIIPAVVNYSVVRGLIEDIVLQNPRRFQEDKAIEIEDNHLFVNETVINILIGGLALLNLIFIGLQVENVYNWIAYKTNRSSLYDSEQGSLFLIAILIGVVLSFMCQNLNTYIKQSRWTPKLLFLYNLSLIALLSILICRYVLKFMSYGIAEEDTYAISIIILIGITLVIFMRNIVIMDGKMLQRFATWGVIVFVLFSLFPTEYVVSQLNVRIFLNRYQNGEISETITANDIDLAYLEDMGYEAIPALLLLEGVSLDYEETHTSLAERANDMVLYMFSEDMSDEEIENLRQIEDEKQQEYVVKILSDKAEYRVIGIKKIVLKAYSEN